MPGRAWLVAVGVVACALGGCASQDRAGTGQREPGTRASTDPFLEACSTKIDTQIEAGRIPNADREYATGMCLRHP